MFCPNCLDDQIVRHDDWTPPEGFDPLMNEYHCVTCKTIFYAVGRRESHRKIEHVKQQTSESIQPLI